MLYNAGSEVYTQTLCKGLTNAGHDVCVFTREENSFRPDGEIRITTDTENSQVPVYLVNNPRDRDRYRNALIDKRCGELLDDFQPDVMHIGHLNHLSTSLVFEAKSRNIPVVYTLHDFWLMCPRGQFMQMYSDPDNLWAACDGQEDRKCATQCYARYFSGAPEERQRDIDYWQSWVSRRMEHVKAIAEHIDLFISPSRYLKGRYEKDFGLPVSKSVFLDYGFDLKKLSVRTRVAQEVFTFGYIGTHIPAKGIHQLIRAFGKLSGDCQLRIWGRERGQDSNALKSIVAELPEDKKLMVHWMPEYKNVDIAVEVFNHTDVIVTPSIWTENSPLVIHEALQMRVPVITANVGGMSENIHHEVNGLLYDFRDVDSLAKAMQRFLDNPLFAADLGKRGYLQTEDGNIPEISDHISQIESLYKQVSE